MSNQAADSPSVAVVIPCYNHGAFLDDALASVRAQTYPRATCLVIDDGSTDPATQRRLDGLRRTGTRVIAQPNQGLAAARNAGIRATDAPFFVPLDADDKLHPRFIERLLPPLSAAPQLGYNYSHARYFGTRSGVWRCPPYDPRRLLLYNLSPATAVIRRAAFDAVGGYQPDMTHGYEDWDFWLALLKAGFQGDCVPEVLFLYRQHPPGVSMLARLEARRADMVRRMIAHHRELYCRLLHLDNMDAEQVYAELAAAVELDRLERSLFWRLLHPVPSPDARATAPPSRHLAELQASAAYRFIRAVKRTRWHRWYAARRYGDSAAGSPADGRVDR